MAGSIDYNFVLFKQKTAYDIGQCLEFRRVLFRSLPVVEYAFVRLTLSWRKNRATRATLLRYSRKAGSNRTNAYSTTGRSPTTSQSSPPSRGQRSEERRVGI